MALSDVSGRWALVLGASSGFGRAISIKLAELGMHVAGVHLDRKATLPAVEATIKEIEKRKVKALFFNINAADRYKRRQALLGVGQEAPKGVHCLVHSLAFGSLKPFVMDNPADQLTKMQMEMTLDAMAHTLVYWVQDMMEHKLLAKGARVFAMTSSGGTRVWPTYGAVSAAKASLESHCRQLAMELAPHEITVNAIRAGVTDTPALRKIPGHEKMLQMATDHNPHNRLTTPEDVANAVALLVHDEANWITGNVIGTDGGEDIVG